MENNIKKNGFTLVELIVVITILAVLWTLAFISLQWYALASRDAVRISDMTTIIKALEFERAKNNIVPGPDSIITLTASWVILSYQWTAGTGVLWQIGISDRVSDPVTQNSYVYSTNRYKTEYQILWFLEANLSWKSIVSETYADNSEKIIFSKGKRLWIIVKSDTYIPLNKSIDGDVFDFYNTDNNHTIIFGSASEKRHQFTDDNRAKLAYYNSRNCKAIYEYGIHDGNKNYTIHPSWISIETYCDMVKGWLEHRNFRIFDGVNDYINIPEVTANWDFVLELDVIDYSVWNIYPRIISHGTANTAFLYRDGNTRRLTLRYFRNDNSYWHVTFASGVLLNDKKIKKVILKRIWNTLILSLWNISVSQIDNNMKSEFIFENIGYWFHWVLANINFKSWWSQNGVANANPYYRLDDSQAIAKNSNNNIQSWGYNNFDSNSVENFMESIEGNWFGRELSHTTDFLWLNLVWPSWTPSFAADLDKGNIFQLTGNVTQNNPLKFKIGLFETDANVSNNSFKTYLYVPWNMIWDALSTIETSTSGYVWDITNISVKKTLQLP